METWLAQNWLTIAGIIIGLAASIFFGDRAGQRAAQKYEEEKARKAKTTAIKALLYEVARIRKLVDAILQSSESDDTKMVRMPTNTFETAFVSGAYDRSASEELLDATADYLAYADRINLLIDRFLWLYPGVGHSKVTLPAQTHLRKNVEASAKELPQILDRLDALLRSELEQELGTPSS